MSYVEQTLSPGETIQLRGRIHWGVWVWPAIWAVIGLATMGFGFIVAIPLAIGAFARQANTEYVVTDRRVIGKWGLVRRVAIEQRLAKIDSVSITQSITGRIFGFGTIVVRGSGSTFEPLKFMADPLAFKASLDQAAHRASEREAGR